MSYYLNKLADWADDTFYPGWNRPRGDLNVYGSQASDYNSNSSNSNLIQNVKRFFGCDKDGCRYHYEMGKRKSSKNKTSKKSMKKKSSKKKSMKKKTRK